MITMQCYECKHYSKNNRCLAFPDGIPFAILSGDVSHTKPYKGDNGIQFEAVDDE